MRNPQQSNEQANPMGQLEKENPFPDPIGLTPRQRSALLRRHALHQKYDKAVALYAETNMPLKTIAMECHVSAGGLGSYLRRYWRELVLHRHRIPLGRRKSLCRQDHVRRKAQCGVACQI
ncbi:hypothetical protein NXU85_13160 [Phocaeicola vulgatus]|nr:hypothetical protein [Phocaeicola vulgatus]